MSERSERGCKKLDGWASADISRRALNLEIISSNLETNGQMILSDFAKKCVIPFRNICYFPFSVVLKILSTDEFVENGNVSAAIKNSNFSSSSFPAICGVFSCECFSSRNQQ